MWHTLTAVEHLSILWQSARERPQFAYDRAWNCVSSRSLQPSDVSTVPNALVKSVSCVNVYTVCSLIIICTSVMTVCFMSHWQCSYLAHVLVPLSCCVTSDDIQSDILVFKDSVQSFCLQSTPVLLRANVLPEIRWSSLYLRRSRSLIGFPYLAV
jgi:hypothetical protein